MALKLSQYNVNNAEKSEHNFISSDQFHSNNMRPGGCFISKFMEMKHTILKFVTGN